MDPSESVGCGVRYSNLKKSFKLGLRFLLTACGKEDFKKAFPTFTSAEHEALFRLFIQVITSLHGNIEEEFDSLCLETKLGATLDTVEQLVEEHNLDILSSEKTNIREVKEEVSQRKKDEIHYLTGILDSAVQKNNLIRAHIETLKKEILEFQDTSEAVGKFRSWNSELEQI